MIFILDKLSGSLVSAEIVLLESKAIPLKKNGWNFNWRQFSKEGKVFVKEHLILRNR